MSFESDQADEMVRRAKAGDFQGAADALIHAVAEGDRPFKEEMERVLEALRTGRRA